MPKKEQILRYKAPPGGTISTKAAVSGSAAGDHGSLAGLADYDHSQYAAIALAETISGDWTVTGAWTISTNVTVDAAITIDGVDLSDHSARHDPDGTDELTTAAPGADSVNIAASGAGVAASLSRSDHTHNLDEAIVPTWTGAHGFQATTTTRDLLPEATDAYDIGNSTYWYSQMFVSQINAAVFAEEQIMLLGGWLYISHDAGVFDVEVAAGDAKIDFGKAMTVSDFIVVKAHVKGGAVATEYIQVGALDAGTLYNVTRDLAGAHAPDPNWAAGTPFAVLGQTGDGRIELNAYDTPRIQIIVQDDAVTYNNTTEYLRLGDMNGAFGSDAADEWGLGVGDYSGGNYMTYNTTDGFELKAGAGAVRLNSAGIRLVDAADSTSYISWKETDFSGDTIGYMTTTWAGGAADDIGFWIYSYKAAGASAGDAVLHLIGRDVTAGTRADILISSAGWSQSTKQFYVGDDTANAKMTLGVSINQAANDDEILAFKSSDVAHGITDYAETDTFGTLSKAQATSGGLSVMGYKDADGAAGYALLLVGRLGEAADTAKTAGAAGVAHIIAQVKSGTGIANVGADGNLCVIANNATSRFIFDAEGSAHADVEWIAFDKQDDLSLIGDLETALTSWQGDGVKAEFGSWLADNQHELERLKLVTFDRDNPGHVMLNTTRLLMLVTGACRQLGERLAVAEKALLCP